MAYPHIFGTQPAGNVPASFLDDNFNAAAQLVSPAFTGTPTAPTPTPGDNSQNIATTAFVIANTGSPAVRQTVLTGPLTAGGYANFLPSTSVNLNLTSQNITAGVVLAVTAANGWSQTTGSTVNATGIATSNITWSSLTNSNTNFLYVTIAGGVLTPGFTTLAPIYQWSGTPATTAGQFTFNISQMQGFLGNGSAAPQTNLVFVGEAVTSGGTVTSTVAYAYNGYFESNFTATLPAASTTTTLTHNLGIAPRQFDIVIQNLTPELGYLANDIVSFKSIINGGSNYSPFGFIERRNTSLFAVGSLGWNALNFSNLANNAVLTVANWQYKTILARGW